MKVSTKCKVVRAPEHRLQKLQLHGCNTSHTVKSSSLNTISAWAYGGPSIQPSLIGIAITVRVPISVTFHRLPSHLNMSPIFTSVRFISISQRHAGGETGRAGYHDGCDQYPYGPFDAFDSLMPVH